MEALATPGVRGVASAASHAAPCGIALLGVGTVGRALLPRLARLQHGGASLRLVHVATSTRVLSRPAGIDARCAADMLRASREVARDPVASLHDAGGGIVVDATGSDAVAECHARWLDAGLHVVTASKLGNGSALSRWRAIEAARQRGGCDYGDSATVGAGLPLLRSLRALRAGGDRIHAVAGVLSGSMAWLFGAYDGLRPFSGFVRQARDAGYTEPDPREDLSGEDVRRKLLILARAVGVPLRVEDVAVESIVPHELARLPLADVDAHLSTLDAPLRERFAQAYKHGERLRHVARLTIGSGRVHARVGVESLSVDDPLCGGVGTDNRVAIWCDRYRTRPLLIQGPGAGAEVTAAALLDDVLRIEHRR